MLDIFCTRLIDVICIETVVARDEKYTTICYMLETPYSLLYSMSTTVFGFFDSNHYFPLVYITPLTDDCRGPHSNLQYGSTVAYPG